MIKAIEQHQKFIRMPWSLKVLCYYDAGQSVFNEWVDHDWIDCVL